MHDTLHRANVSVGVDGVVSASEVRVRIPVLRAQLGLSQRRLAALTGLRPDTVSALERGDAQGIRFETLSRLCAVLQCTPGELFELVDDGHNVPVFGGDDEDDIIRNRLRESGHNLIDGPSFLQALRDGHA